MITMEELQNVFDYNKQKDRDLWGEIMKEVDKDNDNMISFQEFVQVMQSVIKK